LTSEIKKLIKILIENEKKWRSSDNFSVYTGLAGIAYTLYHYGKYDSKYIKVFLLKLNIYFYLKICCCNYVFTDCNRIIGKMCKMCKNQKQIKNNVPDRCWRSICINSSDTAFTRKNRGSKRINSSVCECFTFYLNIFL